MQEPLQIYRERLPWHGHGSDDLARGLQKYPTSELIKKAIVQHNAKHSIGWLVYDLDSATAFLDWQENNCPPPNIAVINRENGHAHLFYGLESPVHKYDQASWKALKYCAAVDVALTIALEADQGYVNFVSKNPTHERWLTLFPRDKLYTLKELADYVPDYMRKSVIRSLPSIALGRNVTLFENLRRWAYAERRQPQKSYRVFHESVLIQARIVNAGFTSPLPESEVRSTAKSVAKWTWKNMSAEGFQIWSNNRRQKSLYSRQQKALALSQEIQKIRKEYPDLSQRDIAAMLKVSAMTVSRHIRAENKAGECLSDITNVTDNSACLILQSSNAT